MQELFGERVKSYDDGRGYRLHFGSAAVDVLVSAWGDSESIIVARIVARATVVRGALMTPELMKYLLNKNSEIRFAAFSVDKDGDIEARHAIVGSTCQKEELKASVQQVMLVADLCDDEIVARWGGLRALDRGR